MRKIVKVLLAMLAMAAIVVAVCIAAYAVITKDAGLDENKLTDYGKSITVCDSKGREMTSACIKAKRKSVKLTDLHDHTANAFVASEDRTFYRHNGLNYARMLKALLTNITARSFRQGASTISQQLIKNTHLTGDKTIARKLREIKLTRQLEKTHTKDEILEMYLNTIYFGHNCYGIENAAEFYFGTTAPELTLEQSATLAGLLASPNNYSPFKNPEKCLKKRNIVLKCMKDCGYIGENEYKSAAESSLSAERSSSAAGFSAYLSEVFDELEELGFDLRCPRGIRIITYADAKLQQYIDSLDCGHDSAFIITDASGGVRAYRTDIGDAGRQPGSTIKPLLVYAPAIEEKMICPATKILDEKISFGRYSPENHDKKYHGYVTVEESITKSYNVPAVKTLNALTLNKAEKYAQKLGIRLDEGEKNLTLALGGMKYGTTLANLCEKYRAFMCGGAYTNTRFIDEIMLKNGQSVYKARKSTKKVFSEGTASLMNDMLCKTVKTGTAKKMGAFSFDVAAKTGTCGNERGNTDAYCIAYTSQDIVGVWLGDKNNTPANVTGGGECSRLAGELIRKLYGKSAPRDLEKSAGTTEVSIDRKEYSENNRIVLADDVAPKLSMCTIKVIKNAVPCEKSYKFSRPDISEPQITIRNDTVCILLRHTDYYSYLIERENEHEKTVIYDGPWSEKIYDTAKNGTYTYTVTPYYDDGAAKHYGKTHSLPKVNVKGARSPQNDLPITKKDWTRE